MEHAGFHGGDRECLEEQADLLRNDARLDWLDRAHFSPHLESSAQKSARLRSPLQQLDGLRAVADPVACRPQLDAPPDRPYPFVYFITIRNDSDETVTIKGRKWVVSDADGHQLVVEGHA